MSAMTNWSGGQLYRAMTCGVLAALAALGSLGLGLFDSIHPGLDSSWVAVLGGAAERGELFGRDLICTGGPFSALYTRFFDSVQWPWILVAGALIAGALAWACGRLAASWHLSLLLPTAILVGDPNAILISLPALAGLAVLIRPGAPPAVVLLATIATAAISLAKFSVIAVAVVSLAIIDIEFLCERRLPIALGGFVASLIGWFALLQGGIAYLIDFLHYSFEISAGYSAAMSLRGSGVELASFLILAAAFGTFVIVEIVRSADQKSATQHVLAAVVVSVLAFVGFKAGFVRHDLHSLISWGIFAIAAAAYTAFVVDTRPDWFLSAVSLASIVTALVLLSAGSGFSVAFLVRDRVQAIGASLSGLAELAADPRGWLQARETAMEQGRAVVRAAIPLPHLNGSVDVLPSMQSAVIAADLHYRPRFTVQDYITYTRALIDKNHASWFGPRAPDYILFGLEPIDGRLPALSEGPLWPDLLRYYEPVQRDWLFAVLRHRSVALPPLLRNPVSRVVRLGERFELGDDPAFLTLDIRLNGLGRLMELMFRPPKVDLHIAFADGREIAYRIIPEITRAGFVVSPFVLTADDFIELALGQSPAFEKSRPVSASVEVGAIGSITYDKDIALTSRAIDVAALRRAQPETPVIDPGFRRDLLAAVPLDPPYVDRVPEGLLVHAPRKIVVPVENARSATVLFGLRNTAWDLNKTKGACFRASSQAGDALWERCLDPLHRVEDRGLQKATFALPPDQTRIVLETLCATNCNWGWTYWAGFEPNT